MTDPDRVLADYISLWPHPGQEQISPPRPPDGYPKSQQAYDDWIARLREPPTNVRIVRADGTVIPLDMAYQGLGLAFDADGTADSTHLWEAVAPADVALQPGDQVKVDELPPGVTISIPTSDDWPG